MDLQIKEFKYPEELDEQRRLFIQCFPENTGTPVETNEHYKWKFKSFPSANKAYEYVAKLDNEIIAYYAAIPYEYQVQEKLVKAAMVCDVMTGIKARGRGVFTKLGIYSTDQFKAEGLAFSTGYPIRPEVIPGHKKAGWELPFQIPMYGKFIKMDAFFKSRNKSFLAPFANILLSLNNSLIGLSVRNSKELTVEKYTSNQITEIPGLDDFFSEWKKENPIVLDKSVQFLKWRLGAPEKKYLLIVLRNKKDNKIIGYTILRKAEKNGVPCLGVLDFCMLDKYQKWSKTLVQQIDKIAKSEKAELILMMMMKLKAKKYNIKKCGFLKTPFPFSFIIKQFDDSINSSLLKEEQNWSLMWIDSDDL
jgi:hypothetical protein